MPNPNFPKMTKQELLKFAAKNKIPAKPAMLKTEIIQLLQRELKKTAKTKKASAKSDKRGTKKIPASTGRTAEAKSKKEEVPVKPVQTQKKKTTKAKPIKKTPVPVAEIAQKERVVSKAGISSTKSRKGPEKKPAISTAAKEKVLAETELRTLHPKFELEDMAQEAKFIVGQPEMGDESRMEPPSELPASYGDNKLVLMARDPYWGFLYWELQQEKIDAGLQNLRCSIDDVRFILRVHPVSENGGTPFDVDIDLGSGRHYLQLSPPGATFYSEIGLLDPKGRFAVLAVSNAVTLPLDGPSDIIDEQWMTTDEEFEKIFALSGGGAYGIGASEEVQKVRREQRRIAFEISSPGVSSFGSAEIQRPGERAFHYWLEAELILYGGADSGSTIRLAGKKLELRPDGTFTARFALPDGTLNLPVTFTSPDEVETHTIAPVVNRTTTKGTGGSNS